MSQYLSAEIVNRKTGDVVATMSLSSRIRDLAYEDDVFNVMYVLNAETYNSPYKGDDYRGTTTVANIEASIRSIREKIDTYRKKLSNSERRLSNAKTPIARDSANEWIETYEDIIDDLESDVDAIKNWISNIYYELNWRDRVRTGADGDENETYPQPLNLDMGSVDIHLWLNV